MFSVAASPFHLVKPKSQKKKARKGLSVSGSWEKGLALASPPCSCGTAHNLDASSLPTVTLFTHLPTEVPRSLARTSDASPERLETWIRTCYLYHLPHTILLQKKDLQYG